MFEKLSKLMKLPLDELEKLFLSCEEESGQIGPFYYFSASTESEMPDLQRLARLLGGNIIEHTLLVKLDPTNEQVDALNDLLSG